MKIAVYDKQPNRIHEILTPHVLPRMIAYQKDHLFHDLFDLTENQNCKFIHVTRETGTEMFFFNDKHFRLYDSYSKILNMSLDEYNKPQVIYFDGHVLQILENPNTAIELFRHGYYEWSLINDRS